MGSSNDEYTRIRKQLIKLYFVQTDKYLVQKQDGKYLTIDSKRHKKNKLADWQLNEHLKGNHTLGAFGGVFLNKFLCFDVDFLDNNTAKWITYKITNTLESYGIHEYVISFSGSKGYHIELFFEDLLDINIAYDFYIKTLTDSGTLEYCKDGNNVEFRPNDRQGVKIPIGQHQKTKQYCGFCLVSNGLSVMNKEDSGDYLFGIQRIQSQRILDILGIDDSQLNGKFSVNQKHITVKDNLKIEKSLATYKELPIYNESIDDKIDKVISLIKNGIKHPHQRHNATLNIAKYFLYSGMDRTDAESELIEWIKKQNPDTYNTPLDEAIKDTKQIVKFTYDREYQFIHRHNTAKVTYEEMIYILDKATETSQILLSYAFLVHGRIFQHVRKNGVFYFPVNSMVEATGLSNKTCMLQLANLELMGVIEIVSRGVTNKGKKKSNKDIKERNMYKLKLNIESETNKVFEANKDMTVIDCLRELVDDKELRKKLGPKRYKRLMMLA